MLHADLKLDCLDFFYCLSGLSLLTTLLPRNRSKLIILIECF